MSDANFESFVAVDIGNSSVHAGLFAATGGHALPQPQATLAHDATEALNELPRWFVERLTTANDWHIASVNDGVKERLVDWLAQRSPTPTIHAITHDRLPLVVDLSHPERVGIDRLLAAVAINQVRDPHCPAIVIDAGTAITVDCVSAAGVFLGGAILPGMRMAAQALDRYTEKLPLVDIGNLHQPTPIGRDTIAAIGSGIFWGARGAVLQLVAQVTNQLDGDPQVFITGGDAQRLQLDGVRIIPHLVLSGIALVARQCIGES